MDHLFVILICSVFPIFTFYQIRSLKSHSNEKLKIRMFWKMCALYWIFAIPIMLLYPIFTAAPADSIPFWFVIVCQVAGILLVASDFLPILLVSFNTELRDKLQEQFKENNFIYPETRREQLGFVFVAITVGICEEIMFRSFMYEYIKEHLSLGALWSLIIASIIFALGHYIQGIGGVIVSLVLGLFLGTLYIWGGTLLAPILVHILFDLKIVIMSVLLKKRTDSP
ncbi:CPBP family intramembrane glutamic endopeptidase [Paenibacillus sp. MBLB4367]|uniref:CPBP family intramembrane glutamic endopeptidase n=1 Tax=Paenibacillus sp. MBLB4367 TaxID=3384767 RepID=UPI00390811B8